MSPSVHPDRIWWSPAEIAAAKLPGLPGTKRKVNALIEREGWADRSDKARRRAGRDGGGGMEYHWHLLPTEARVRLLKDAAPSEPAADSPVPTDADIAERHRAFESMSERARDTARMRLRILNQVEALEQSGLGRVQAVQEIAAQEAKAARSIWNWIGRVEHVAPQDRLVYLADGRSQAKRTPRKAEISAEFMDLLTGC